MPCTHSDDMSLGQLLRAADLGVDEANRVLTDQGVVKQLVRESGAVIHAKIVYGNSAAFVRGGECEGSLPCRQESVLWGAAELRYEYRPKLISRDAFATVRQEVMGLSPWVAVNGPPSPAHTRARARTAVVATGQGVCQCVCQRRGRLRGAHSPPSD